MLDEDSLLGGKVDRIQLSGRRVVWQHQPKSTIVLYVSRFYQVQQRIGVLLGSGDFREANGRFWKMGKSSLPSCTPVTTLKHGGGQGGLDLEASRALLDCHSSSP